MDFHELTAQQQLDVVIDLREKLTLTEQQRDELLTALDQIGNTACGEASHQYMAHVAIAKVKPSKHSTHLKWESDGVCYRSTNRILDCVVDDMTKALELAKECAGYGGGKIVMFTHDELEQFYRLAQAQALRDAAAAALESVQNFLFTIELKQMAEDLEKQP